jgi:hypothetical protein
LTRGNLLNQLDSIPSEFSLRNIESIRCLLAERERMRH